MNLKKSLTVRKEAKLFICSLKTEMGCLYFAAHFLEWERERGPCGRVKIESKLKTEINS